MAPKRKQTPRNAFYYFMVELKNRNKYNSMAEAADAAGPLWAKMSGKEREPYEKQALMNRNALRGTKLTCDGYAVEDAEREQEQEQLRVQEMKDDINLNLKLSQKRNCIHEEMFFIIHVNIFCNCPSINRYFPAEIGVVGFNLEEGVLPERVFHKIIKPGSLPLGFARDAKLHSDGTHQLPPPLGGENENNTKEVFEELKKFLLRFTSTSRGYPILYANDRRLKMVQDVLDTWCYDFDEDKPLFKVYSLEYMFQVLRNSVSDDDQVWPSDTFSSREIEKDVYAYATNISCDIHEVSNVSNYCSRSVAVRYAFIICDNCCKDLNITMIPGQHIPKKSGYTSGRARSVASSSSFSSAAPSEVDDDARSLISVSSKRSWGNASLYSQSSAFTLDNDSTFPKLGSERRRQARGREPPYEYLDYDSDVSSQLSFASAVGSTSTKQDVFASDFKKFSISDDKSDGTLDEFPSISRGRGRGGRKNANWGLGVQGGFPSTSRGRGSAN